MLHGREVGLDMEGKEGRYMVGKHGKYYGR